MVIVSMYDPSMQKPFGKKQPTPSASIRLVFCTPLIYSSSLLTPSPAPDSQHRPGLHHHSRLDFTLLLKLSNLQAIVCWLLCYTIVINQSRWEICWHHEVVKSGSRVPKVKGRANDEFLD